MMRQRGTSVRRMTAAVALATACGLVSAPGSQAAARHASSARRASALLSQAFADARAKGSFHQSLVQVSGKTRGTLTDDVTLDTGRQLIRSSDGTRAEVEVIGQTAYMYGNQRALESYFKFSSDEVAVIGTNWVSVPSTNTAFASLAYDVTVTTALDEVSPSGHLTEGHVTTLDGERVIPISGGVPSGFSGGAGSRATLYVTAGGDPLPVRASVDVQQAHKPAVSLTGTLTDWGEHVAVSPPTGQALSTTQVNELASQLSGFTIQGEPGYFAIAGQQGQAVPFGRPWGAACQPIRFAVDSSVPGWVYSQIASVVAQARAEKIDVVLESRDGRWKHSALYYRGGQSAATTKQVKIVAGAGTPSTAKHQAAMRLTTDTKLDANRHNDDLTSVTAAFDMQVVGSSTASVRRSIRQLIAWTQGISETTDPISGITQRSFTDRFTTSDLSAMLTMSGCSALPTTVTGIAA